MHSNDSTITAGIQPCPWGKLPKSARVLYVTTSGEPAARLRDFLDADNSMAVELHEALGVTSGFAHLRNKSFDAVLVRHLPRELDALAFVEAHRASGAQDALLVLGDQPEQQFAPFAYEVGADAYLRIESTGPRQMIWVLARAIEWHRLVRENRRQAQYEQHRLRLEHGEAERLLAQQRGLVNGLEELTDNHSIGAAAAREPGGGTTMNAGPLDVPTALVGHYSDLMRAHVIMGSGNLARETAAVVDALQSLNLPAPRVMQLHLHALEATLRGLGSRSSRHVMARADLLVLEVMTQLAERYRVHSVGNGLRAVPPNQK
jgi:hypothetical protein